MHTFRFNQCLVYRDGSSVHVRCPANDKTTLTLEEGGKPKEGTFKAGAALFAMVQGAKGEPGINPFEDVQDDRTYSPFIEFIFHGDTVLAKVMIDDEPWLEVKSVGSVDLYGTMEAAPFDEKTMHAATWMTVMEKDPDPDPPPRDPGPHAPNRERPAGG